MGKRRGRPRKDGPRKLDGTLERGKLVSPPDHIIAKRAIYSFVTPTKGPDGRGGEIDQDICDGIGQLHALGLLDGYPVDGLELRNIGREYAELYWERYQETAPVCGQLERRPRSTGNPPPINGRYVRFDKLDSALPRNSMERTVLYMLLVNNHHSDTFEGWVQRVISRALVERGVSDVVAFLDSATEGHDRYMLSAAIRGLVVLHLAGTRGRDERRAA